MATKKTRHTAKPKKHVAPLKKTSVFTKIWQFAKNNPALAFLIVVFAGVAIYGSIYLFERWQFSTAEKKLDTVASAIVAELGEPTSIEKNKSCSYRSTVFEDQRGLPACSVGYKIEYSYADYNLANSIRNTVYKTLLDDGFTLNTSTFLNYDDNPNSYEFPDEYTGDSLAFLNCSVSVENYNNKQIDIYLGCSNDKTLIQIFPID